METTTPVDLREDAILAATISSPLWLALAAIGHDPLLAAVSVAVGWLGLRRRARVVARRPGG